MKIVGFTQSLPINDPKSLQDLEVENPKAGPLDLVVKINAVSVNPVDFKIRQSAAKETTLEEPKIIGWDAAGVVTEIGSDVKDFKVGDEVYYSGDLTKPGCYAEFQAIGNSKSLLKTLLTLSSQDSRIVAKKPKSISFAEAASYPLVTITAYETLFDRFNIPFGDEEVIGGGGAVGSMAIQLAKAVTKLKVIGTSSRPETAEWVTKMGADDIINHRNLKESAEEKGYKNFDYIFATADTLNAWDSIVALIAPQGSIGLIVETANTPIDIGNLQSKSARICWEFMFTRSMFDVETTKQGELLAHTAKLIDEKSIKSLLNEAPVKGFNAENLRKLHEKQESGKSIGKNVLEF